MPATCSLISGRISFPTLIEPTSMTGRSVSQEGKHKLPGQIALGVPLTEGNRRNSAQYNTVSCSLWSVSLAREAILPRMLQLMTSTQLFQKPPESSCRARKYLFEISVGAV
ncbi:hypothetical protein SAMN05216404_11943 [Nitrosospira multiformis]|uniref:Uncharacterized protein n=1 Tax=Nitrosospira multiformis TaxID=1231 RepID=A0A1H8P8H9_9PROT|nr:hypothetical protein SAMN05216404_11943 [Nitrosospira multiformis]